MWAFEKEELGANVEMEAAKETDVGAILGFGATRMEIMGAAAKMGESEKEEMGAIVIMEATIKLGAAVKMRGLSSKLEPRLPESQVEEPLPLLPVWWSWPGAPV
jgi:hypothetical protein